MQLDGETKGRKIHEKTEEGREMKIQADQVRVLELKLSNMLTPGENTTIRTSDGKTS